MSHLYHQIKKYRKILNSLEAELGRVPTKVEIDAEYGCDTTEISLYTIEDEENKDEMKIRFKISAKNVNLETERLKLGLTQVQLAEKIGISNVTYSGIESLRLYPQKKSQQKICVFFKKTPAYLFPPWLETFSTRWKEMEKEKTVVLNSDLLSSSQFVLLGGGQDEMQQTAENSILKSKIEHCMEELSPREKKILEMRFGFKDGVTHTFEEVAREFGITRERVRQIEFKAYEKLQCMPGFKELKCFVKN